MAGSDPARWPFGLREPLGALRPLDAVLGGYLALATVVLAFGATRGVPGCASQLALDLGLLAGLALVCAVSRRTTSRALAVLRLGYAPLIFTPLYRQTATLWPALYERPFDPWLVRAEQALWGGQPSLAFAQHAPWPWLSELLCLAYFTYYLFVPAVLFTALFTRGYAASERAIFATTTCFCCCYTLFWLFPVIGPLYWFPPNAGPALYGGYVFNHLLYMVTSRGEVPAGAFPSSHIAVALLLTIQARRVAPRLFPFMLAVTALMCAAVVYLKAHYLVDVPAGILVGLVVLNLVDRKQATEPWRNAAASAAEPIRAADRDAR
ncbi:MAG TPA: phosphatase PAP2 family protein [Gammaproteobacteria bacterium]|nr:phosphatase PAP2 family protein [Gammaproteobacteria bacterium]